MWSMCTMFLLVFDLDVLLLSDVNVSHLSVVDLVLAVEDVEDADIVVNLVIDVV